MSAEANPKETPAIDSDFKAVVEESRAAIQAQEITPPKRGRGRPKKSSDSAKVTEAPSQSLAGPAQPPPNISTYLEFPLIALSKGPARKHDLPELALTQEEAKACAEALQACLNAFLPDVNNMSPKTAAIAGLLVTVGSIGFTKYSMLADKQAEIAKRNPPKPEPEIQEINAIKQEAASIPADSYFAR